MPLIRSDDGPRKLRAVWLGPKGATLPFEWTFVQWLVCVLCTIALGTVVLVALWVAWAPIYGMAGAVLYGPAGGFYIGAKLMHRTSFDEPIQYRVPMMIGQIRDRGRSGSNDEVEWRVRLPPVRDLGPGARRALGWPHDSTLTEKEGNDERTNEDTRVTQWRHVGGRGTAVGDAGPRRQEG